MTPCNIFGCVIDDASASSMTKTVTVRHQGKKWNFTAVVVVVGHVIHPTPTIQQLGT